MTVSKVRGDDLDSLGGLLGVEREVRESDWSYRYRLVRKVERMSDD